MIQNYLGEFAALLTAVFWTITALAFQQASRKVGSLVVNILRLGFAMVFYSIFLFFYQGTFYPSDAGMHQWIWLAVSGVVGFVLGDLFLFEAYKLIGARISMLIMALAPPIAAFSGWLALGENMSWIALLGMFVTMTGIALVILQRKSNDDGSQKKITLTHSLKGLLFAFGGAMGQGIGLVLSKYGMQDYDPIASSHIRVITGFVGFTFIISIMGKWRNVGNSFSNIPAMKNLSIGTIFGPFLGVSMSLIAVKYTSAGIASTLMQIVPVLIIAPSVFLFKEKVTWREIFGAIVTVIGVALFFVK